MKNSQVNCQNCEEPYEEGFQFCPHCGQKTNDELTLSVLFYNTISNYFSFDARFFKSFIPLMFRPGYLASKFLEGKRLLYLHPAQMYLFVSVIFFFILSFSTRELVQKADELNDKVVNSDVIQIEKDTTKKVLDSLQLDKIIKPLKDNKDKFGIKDEDFRIADSIIKASNNDTKNINTSWNFNKEKIDSMVAAGADKELIYKEMGMSDNPNFVERRLFPRILSLIEGQGAGSLIQAFFDTVPISMFFLLPFFALILKIFYYNKGRYVYHLVFSFYYFSFLFTVFSILFAVNRFVIDIPDSIDWLIALSTFFYLLLAIIKFYRQHWFLSLIKTGIISFLFLLLVLPVSIVLLGLIVFLFY